MVRALAAALILATLFVAQEPTTFRGGISLVELDASVFDTHGVIEALKPEDFVVKDERQPIALRYCVQEDSPLDLVLLLELTRMMAANQAALRGATEVAMAATHEGDRLGVM